MNKENLKNQIQKWSINIANNVRWLRVKSQLTQAQMAEKIGMNYRYYQNFEGGKLNPTVETILKVADSFNVQFDWLTTFNSIYFKKNFNELLDDIGKVFDNAPFAVVVRDKEFNICYFNPYITKFEGYDENTLKSKKTLEFLTRNSQEAVQTAHALQEERLVYPYQIAGLNGNSAPIHCKSFPITLVDGKKMTNKATLVAVIPMNEVSAHKINDYYQRAFEVHDHF